jgi:hypothetical protein
VNDCGPRLIDGWVKEVFKEKDMSERVILMFGPEQPWDGAPVDYFWLYSIEQKKVIYPPFASAALARVHAKAKEYVIVEQWDPNDLFVIEEVIHDSVSDGAFIVFMTAFCGGHIASDAKQPKHRYWGFKRNGTLVGTRATPADAFRLIGALAPPMPADEANTVSEPTLHDRSESQP